MTKLNDTLNVFLIYVFNALKVLVVYIPYNVNRFDFQ